MHIHRFSPLPLARLGAWLLPALLAVPPLAAQPANGTYSGTTDQGRPISIVVSNGNVTSWTLSYACPGFTSTTTVNPGSCPIIGNSFSCGSTSCIPFASLSRLTGTFAGATVSGTFSVNHKLNTVASCCILSNRSWSATGDGGGGTCSGAATVSCGDTVAGSNDAAGSTDHVDGYSCNGFGYPGPEFTYLFTPAADDQVTIDLTGLSDDLDLLVLADQGAGCDADECLADSTNGGTDDEQVVLDVTAGEEYYIVVDGYDGATSGYSLSLTCPAAGLLFSDGFESGDLSAWSDVVP